MTEVFANAQRVRSGQSSEKASYVINEDQLCLFNEAVKKCRITSETMETLMPWGEDTQQQCNPKPNAKTD